MGITLEQRLLSKADNLRRLHLRYLGKFNKDDSDSSVAGTAPPPAEHIQPENQGDGLKQNSQDGSPVDEMREPKLSGAMGIEEPRRQLQSLDSKPKKNAPKSKEKKADQWKGALRVPAVRRLKPAVGLFEASKKSVLAVQKPKTPKKDRSSLATTTSAPIPTGTTTSSNSPTKVPSRTVAPRKSYRKKTPWHLMSMEQRLLSKARNLRRLHLRYLTKFNKVDLDPSVAVTASPPGQVIVNGNKKASTPRPTKPRNVSVVETPKTTRSIRPAEPIADRMNGGSETLQK